MTTPISPAFSAPDEDEWSRVNIPAEGTSGSWLLAKGSDVKHLTMATHGTLYAYANPSGTSYRLFKSVDSGHGWSSIGRVEDEIVAIATGPEDDSVIYYATACCVYKSSDGGDSFHELPPSPGGAGGSHIEITTIDVAQLDGHNMIAVGTRDTDNSEYGGVYTFTEDEGLFPTWVDTEIGDYDVYRIAFSPHFIDDAVMAAAVTDEVSSYTAYNYGTSVDWNTVELRDTTDGSFAITGASNLGFTADFGEPYPLFVGVVGGDGGIYHVDDNHAQRLNGIDADIISLGVASESGALELMAGENDSAEVWYSSDSGSSWDLATKAPTGSGPTYVVMAPDFASSRSALAATSGSESAISATADGGITWNQIGLIDTMLNTILDLALSPHYGQDETLFMLTWSGEHSLWRSLDDASDWERVFSSSLPDVDSLSLVAVSPEYSDESQVVFLAGTRNGSPIVWKSTDNGQSFSFRRTAPLAIDTWAIANDDTLFIGGYDGSGGLVYYTTNSGRSYSTETVVAGEPLSSLVLSPDYELDETILVGSTNGSVYWSSDNGASFEPLPPDATVAPLTGSIAVAFDPGFTANRTVYAASDTAGKGIFRFKIGSSTEWDGIASPAGGMFQQLGVSADGTLYATNFKADGGLERSLNPTYSLGPTFETVTRGLDDGAKLTKLWLRGKTLWSIDTANVRLMTFTDSLTVPVTLKTPANQAQGVGIIIDNTIKDIELDWETLSGATEYEWQLDDDTDFSSVLFEGSTGASSERLPALEMATTYYWQVRASQPVLSPWSEKWSFHTSMGGEASGPELISPAAGATGIAIKPIFEWSALAGAEDYELIVSTSDSLDNPTILKTGDYALPNTAWECNINLEYDTTYYWKARAVNAETHSDWSMVSAFTTRLEPEPPEGTVSSLEEPQEEPKPPPTEPATTATPDWLKYVMGALLATVILLSVIVLVLVRNLKRPQS